MNLEILFPIFRFSNFSNYLMVLSDLIPHIESLIFASDKPLTAMEMTELLNNAFGFMDDKLTLDQIQTGIDGIVDKYNTEFYPFEVRESGGGWQFLSKKAFHKTIAQLNGEKFLKRLSIAALETLAIVAYKQPITKGEIESIRGVNSDYSIQKLLEKELIVIIGRNEDMPGKPLIYATSKTFMDYFGINQTSDLPRLKEVLGESLEEPSLLNYKPITPEINPALVVSEEGELLENNTTSSGDPDGDEEA
jgi:segregation and condensation protein B